MSQHLQQMPSTKLLVFRSLLRLHIVAETPSIQIQSASHFCIADLFCRTGPGPIENMLDPHAHSRMLRTCARTACFSSYQLTMLLRRKRRFLLVDVTAPPFFRASLSSSGS